MSLESIIEESLEKALVKGGKKAVVKGVEELIDRGIIEEVTRRIINVTVAEIMKIIQVGVALAIGKAIIGSNIAKSEDEINALKKGIMNSLANQYDNGNIEGLIKEIFQSHDEGEDGMKKV